MVLVLCGVAESAMAPPPAVLCLENPMGAEGPGLQSMCELLRARYRLSTSHFPFQPSALMNGNHSSVVVITCGACGLPLLRGPDRPDTLLT